MVTRLIIVSFLTSSCIALPKPPNVPICLYDNYSKEDKSDRFPNFKCVASNGTEFKINWNSSSAKNMVSMPHDDFVKLNSFYKKVFDVLEKEFLNKTRR